MDSSRLVPVVTASGGGVGRSGRRVHWVAVCQGQRERPLCFGTAAEYERGETDLNATLGLAAPPPPPPPPPSRRENALQNLLALAALAV